MVSSGVLTFVLHRTLTLKSLYTAVVHRLTMQAGHLSFTIRQNGAESAVLNSASVQVPVSLSLCIIPAQGAWC